MPVVVVPASSSSSSQQVVATVVLYDYLLDETGKALIHATVRVTLNTNAATMTTPQLFLEAVQQTATTDSNGYWSVNVVPNLLIAPSGTSYIVQDPFRSYRVQILGGAGPFQASTILA